MSHGIIAKESLCFCAQEKIKDDGLTAGLLVGALVGAAPDRQKTAGAAQPTTPNNTHAQISYQAPSTKAKKQGNLHCIIII